MGKNTRKAKCRNRKELSDLEVCRALFNELKKDITQNCESEWEERMLRNFMTTETVTIHSVKEVIENSDSISTPLLLRTFFRCVLISNDESFLRNIAASFLDRINCSDNSTTQAHGMLLVVLRDFLQCVRHDLSVEAGRHTRNVISFCMTSNFDTGQRLVLSIANETLAFLCHYLNNLIPLCTTSSKIVQHDIAAGLKCVATLVKKKSELTECDRDIEDHVEELLETCMKVFSTDSLEWDCNCAAGLSYVSLLRAVNDDMELLNKLKEVLLRRKEQEGDFKLQYSTFHQKLSICNGALALLSHQILFKTSKNDQCSVYGIDNILTEVILPAIKDVDQTCNVISDQLIVAKCYLQWSRQVLNACVIDECLPSCRSMIGSDFLKDLFDNTIMKLGHPTDAIRRQANDMLINILKIGDLIGYQLSQDLLSIVLRQNWKKRSTFAALNCLLQHVSPETVFKIMPQINERLLIAIGQQSLAPYASETYRILAERTSQSYGQTALGAENVQYVMFFNPLLEAMCQSSINSLQFLVNYCFVKLLKVYGEAGVVYLLGKFEERQSESDTRSGCDTQILASILNCLKVSMMRKVITSEHPAVCNDHIQCLIKSSLFHQNNEIRHLAFSFFCESSRPSSFISTYTLDSVRHALPFNMSCQDPAFRQKLIVSIKKMLLQLKGNLIQLRKAPNRDKIQSYHDFLCWMVEFVLTQLEPSVPYMKRITSITLFSLLVENFVDYSTDEFQPSCLLYTVNSVQSLFALLSDPYPDVREHAYTLLSQQESLCLVKLKISDEWLQSMYSEAFARGRRCSQPEYCIDSSYHMRLYAAMNAKNEFDRNVSLLKIGKDILHQLQDDLTRAKKNLYVAALSSPMYGLLYCLKCLLQDVQFKNMPGTNRKAWRSLISIALSTCLEVSEAVLPVVGSVSPEGCLPELEQTVTDEINGGADDAWNKLPEVIKSLVIGNSIDEHDESNTRVISQQILICCWRSAKESSLLLQELTSSIIPLDSVADQYDGVVSWSQLLLIGEHLKLQLRTARHRGAFELTYYAFKAYCPRLWNNDNPELNSIPENWLRNTLCDLEDPKRLQDLCATRRSAGLPFFMQALLSCNKSAKGRTMLQNVMSCLLKLSKTSDQEMLVSKVHSLNILRGLVKDSMLGEEILPYISQCIMVSLSGFKSTVWAVRNSSTLLFSALFTRVFGVKQDKNDVTSAKNRLSANEFFARLPGLHSFLYDCLKNVVQDLEFGGYHALAPILHPILLLLSRIYPSTMPSVTNSSLAEFIPLLMKCRATAVYKSRVAASLALASIVAWDECINALSKCCHNLTTDMAILCGTLQQNSKSSSHNRVHGGLLQVKKLLLKFADNDAFLWSTKNCLEDAVRSVRRDLRNVFTVLTARNNRCLLTKSAAIDLFLVTQNLLPDDDQLKDDDIAKQILTTSTALFESEDTESAAPGRPFLLESAGNFLVVTARKFETLGNLVQILTSTEDSEKLLSILNAILSNWNVFETRFVQDLCFFERIIRNAIRCQRWGDEIVTLMYRILSNCAREENITVLQKSFLDASACNASQSRLLVALIEFQAVCISVVMKQPATQQKTTTLDEWVRILSRSSKSFENTDDVRLAVANSLSTNLSVYLCKDESLGSTIVSLWEILLRLLCDEEANIREVASSVVYKVNLMESENVGTADTHPCIDSLALHHAFRLLIQTQGKTREDDCRSVLEWFRDNQAPSVVPATFKERGDCVKTPKLFESSQINTYFDSKRISAAAEHAISCLDSGHEF